MLNDPSSVRWDPYVLATEENFNNFWTSHFDRAKRDVLFIIGRGFDCRATLGSERICGIGGKGRRDALLVNFSDDSSSTSKRAEMVNENVERYKAIFREAEFNELCIQSMTSGHQTGTSRRVSKIVDKNKDIIVAYDDIIIDISAMPRIVAITLMVKILYFLDQTYLTHGKDINLHMLTAESVLADKIATPTSLSEGVSKVVGFSGELNGVANEHIPRIWFPVLGEEQSEKLNRIREEIRPDEICPVIPFPSKNPRRGDEIINAYRQTLFDDFQIDPKNMIYASEANPFEAYKRIFGAIVRYRDSLRELGGCKAFVSPLSSKLLSVGAVLACYEHRELKDDLLKVGITYIEAASYGEPLQSIPCQAE